MSPAIKGDDTLDHNALCCGPVWLVIVRTSYLPPVLRTSHGTSTVVVRSQLEMGLVTKDYTSPVSAIPRWLSTAPLWSDSVVTGLRNKHHNGQREYKFRFMSYVPKVMMDTCVQAKRWIVDNDKFGALTAALTIALSSCSTMALWSNAAVLILISTIIYSLLPTLSTVGSKIIGAFAIFFRLYCQLFIISCLLKTA